MRGKRGGRVTKSKHKTRKILVAETEDPVLIKQRAGSSFNAALPLRRVKAAKDGGGVRRWGQSTKTENCLNSSAQAGRTRREGSTRGEVKLEFSDDGAGPTPLKSPCCLKRTREENRRDDKLQRVGPTEEPHAASREGRRMRPGLRDQES